jgi:hypothetical protein
MVFLFLSFFGGGGGIELAKGTGEIVWIATCVLPFCVLLDGMFIRISLSVLCIVVTLPCSASEGAEQQQHATPSPGLEQCVWVWDRPTGGLCRSEQEVFKCMKVN